ncbi:hypothetical protein IP83_15690 [Novosphingobium sp. AAP93]|nr:hypothetical protein IP83_15690 [Novosphingobium sp. AAP93]
MTAREVGLTLDLSIIRLSVDLARHPELKSPIEGCFNCRLPDFGDLHGDTSTCLGLRTSRCDWLLLGSASGMADRAAAMKLQLAGAPAIITDVSDSFVAVYNVDSVQLATHSAVLLRGEEARPMQIGQVDVMAFCQKGLVTLLIPRSYRGAPCWQDLPRDSQ